MVETNQGLQMTREQSLMHKPYVVGECDHINCATEAEFYDNERFEKLIDSIFDSLENQKCENCFHKYDCGWLDAIEKDVGARPMGFGCNGWKSNE